MLVLYGDTHEEDEMFQPFSRELAAERIADLRRLAEHDRLVKQVSAPDRPANRPRLWKLVTASEPRTSAT
jgi:hypothetical protein